MWMREAMLFPMMAMRGAMLWPAVAAGMAAATGQAMAQTLRRETLRAIAEAAECVEDAVGEVRTARLVIEDDETGPVEVIAGRAAGSVALARPIVGVVHAGPRRVRLRAAAGSEETLALGDRISGFPGVRRVFARPLTGSLIVETEGEGESLPARLERAGLVRVMPFRLPHPAEVGARLLLDRLDRAIRSSSRGEHDLASVIAMVLDAAEVLRERGAARGWR